MTAHQKTISALILICAVVPFSAGDSLAQSAPAPASRKAATPDYASHVKALEKRLPHKGFTIVLQKPFVVVGDERPSMVKLRAQKTVKWAVDLLKKDFFPKDPAHIIDIWLFKDKSSYRKHALELFGDTPDTPFGYYSSTHRALVMNISTGGGTLVHEIVHPFIAANFPGCPSWFNEGLASLYEQCRERDGRITGLTNWRLAGLQKAIKGGTVPSFEKLTAMTTSEFYEKDRGTNYAQARYLLYYLQEKKLLRAYYRRFLAQREKDPTGFAALKKTLGAEDMAAFKKNWEAYVLKLRFP
jgi:hypothetical protein